MPVNTLAQICNRNIQESKVIDVLQQQLESRLVKTNVFIMLMNKLFKTLQQFQII